MQIKPLYKISIIAVVMTAAAFGIYFAWKGINASPLIVPPTESGARLPVGETTDGEKTNGKNESPTVGKNGNADSVSAKPKKLSEEAAFDLWKGGDTGEIFYLTPTGNVLGLKEGPDPVVSKQTFGAPNFLLPSPKNDKALLAFGDPISPQWGIFDNADKVWRPLPSEIELAAWAGSSDKLFAVIKNGNTSNLSELNIAVTPPSAKIILKDFPLKDIGISGINPEEIFVHEKPSSLYSSRLWKINIRKFSFNQIFAPVQGLWLKWLGNIGLEFRSPQNFRLVDKNLKEPFPLAFSTFPSKCTVGETTSTVYCFVPKELPAEGFDFPDDYFTKKFMSIDDLYVIDLENENFEKILESQTADIPAIDAKNPVYAGSKIYVINRYDNGVYEIKLR